MNDQYRIHTGSRPADSGRPPQGRADREPSDRTTGALWMLLAVCVALNAVFSVARPDNLLLSIGFGAPALLCLVALLLRYLQRRR